MMDWGDDGFLDLNPPPPFKLSFARRRKFILSYWGANDAINRWAGAFADHFHLHPRKHSVRWFVANLFFVPCSVCLFERALVIGLVLGLALGARLF
jgi:hypothetical protein